MGRLIYTLNVSLDGYVATPDGGLDWTVVDDELHQWFNDFTARLDASFYGRRLYELMSAHWPTAGSDPDSTETEREFARLWLAMPKIVFSATLDHVDWNSRLVRGDPATELARARREFDGDIDVGGATLAASFIRAGLVDELGLVVHPVVLGAGKPFLPQLERPLRLSLFARHEFSSGAVYLGYRRIE
ncbi:MAG TPA: dihydrofolate reductase family protein [Candidatus Limnocylindrales bacterium]